MAEAGVLTAAELLDPSAIEDPTPLFDRLRETAPIARVEGTGVWVLSSWALVEEAVLRDDDLSANLTGLLYTDERGLPAIFELGEIASSAGAVIATADEPHHAVHRASVQPRLVAAEVGALEPRIRGWVAEATQAWIDAGGGDYAAAVAEPVPSRAVAVLLGLPESDVPRLQRWAMTGGDMLAGTTTPDQMAALGAQTGEMASYLAAALAESSMRLEREPERPAAHMIDALARSVAAGAFDAGSAVGIAITMVGAGGESTASLVGNSVRLLAERPGLQDRLRGDPGLIPRYVEEALRVESPFRFHYRVVKRDCTLGGAQLRKGERVMLGWAAANRDPQEFARPGEIDLERRYPKRHLGFGRGRHFCIGAHLARLEARVAIEELLSRTTRFALDPEHPPRHIPSIFVRRLRDLFLRVS